MPISGASPQPSPPLRPLKVGRIPKSETSFKLNGAQANPDFEFEEKHDVGLRARLNSDYMVPSVWFCTFVRGT